MGPKCWICGRDNISHISGKAMDVPLVELDRGVEVGDMSVYLIRTNWQAFMNECHLFQILCFQIVQKFQGS